MNVHILNSRSFVFIVLIQNQHLICFISYSAKILHGIELAEDVKHQIFNRIVMAPKFCEFRQNLLYKIVHYNMFYLSKQP